MFKMYVIWIEGYNTNSTGYYLLTADDQITYTDSISNAMKCLTRDDADKLANKLLEKYEVNYVEVIEVNL